MIGDIILGWKGAAITGALALTIGSVGGWKAKGVKVDADKAKALEVAQAAHIEAMAALQLDLDEMNRDNLRLSGELQTAQSKTRTVTREIIKEVPAHAPISTPECDHSLSFGLVRLHNYAALGDAPDSEAKAPTANGFSGNLPTSEYISDYP